ncbi:monocarboxylate transporter 12 isoform X1 [Anopheles darlingi]|uniref:monocarboxylate transporter 12 isoform X1 n=2 Tax=Anopheles darlingi TaxID=43151 RepID=UPI0021005AD2|nr:monocarboxylate transporter 12 isoform X1 [Anopheles darlingi]XP_049531152.1 monocarboxylate transporter 12 isoform X1 [Anopheles darlingi]XP_049531159.1 monocarboxylate transporter 12 isoform X1 [Anopheles darlingi]
MTHGPPASRKRQQQQLNSDIEQNIHDVTRELEEEGLPTPPDGGWGWMVVLASFSIHIITDGLTYSFGIFYSEFLTYFNEGKGYTAWIASILVGVTLCSGPISSSLVNRYGCRAVTIAGALLASASLAVSMFATSVLMLFITIGVGTGLGLGLIYLPAIVSVTMYFERLRSLATGIAVCGSGLGTSIFAPLTETLIKRFEWQGALLAIAGIVLICVIFGWMFRPLKPSTPADRRGRLESAVSATAIVTDPATVPLQQQQQQQQQQPQHSTERSATGFKTIQGTSETSGGGNLARSNSHGILAGNSPRIDQNGHSVSGHNLDKRTLADDEKHFGRSQPLLAVPGDDHQLQQQQGQQGQSDQQHGSVGTLKHAESGTMYRKDALYTGSVHNIASRHPSQVNLATYEKGSYGSVQGDGCSNGRLVPGRTVGSGRSSVVGGRAASPTNQEERCLGCIPCSRETCDTFREMMNFSILKDPVFIVFTVSNFLTSVGFNVPYVYLTEQALATGIDTKQASYLLGIIGIANTLGRIVLGYLSDKTWVNRLAVYNISLSVCGVATALSVLCYNFETLAVYSGIFGFTIGAYVGLTSVILVDLLGLEKLTNAFGLLLLFQGIASLIGPPIAGWLYDYTLSYGPGFVMAGTAIGVSGLMLFGIPALQRYLVRRRTLTDQATIGIPLH